MAAVLIALTIDVLAGHRCSIDGCHSGTTWSWQPSHRSADWLGETTDEERLTLAFVATNVASALPLKIMDWTEPHRSFEYFATVAVLLRGFDGKQLPQFAAIGRAQALAQFGETCTLANVRAACYAVAARHLAGA